MRILVLERFGQLAREFQQLLSPSHEVVALGSSEIDLADPDTYRFRIREIKPEVILNTAAYTAVDQAEEEIDKAYAINGEAPGILAEEAKFLGARFIHYSTDYVFDGRSESPYSETAIPSPINVYGKSKWMGETAVQAVGGDFLILRTSWIYGWHGRNFLQMMRKFGRERESIDVVSDQIGTPTWSKDIAQATIELLSFPDAQGVYHLTSQGETSWYGFAQEILKESRCKVNPISSEKFGAKAPRPAYSVLCSQKMMKEFGIQLPSWREALAACMQSDAAS